jgi:HlyD family secretion protein
LWHCNKNANKKAIILNKSYIMFKIFTLTLLLSTASFAQSPKREIPIPAIAVVKPVKKLMQEKFIFSGTLVARDEYLVSTEIDGLRITNILAEEGDKVKKGQVLARLNDEILQVQLRQFEASLDKAKAGVAQAKSNIVQADASLEEAKAQYNRASALLEKKDIAPTIYDQRNVAFKLAESRAISSREGLKLSEADAKLIEAQKADTVIRLSRTEIKAPVDGIISRRTAKVGQMVAGANLEPLFRIIAGGLIELEGDILETRLTALKAGQKVNVNSAGIETTGDIRLVPSEVDRNTRLGRVRVALNPDANLKLGSFARGTVNVLEREGLAVPSSAIAVQDNGDIEIQVVMKDTVQTRKVTIGIKSDGLTEVRTGLVEGEQVVVRAGPFLRNGDKVKALEGAK